MAETYGFSYTGTIQTFTPSVSGYYQLEAWGASGGGSLPGMGGYATGVSWLNEGATFFVVVGGTTTSNSGGYNDGGKATNTNAYGGGGATHIAVVSGLLTTLSGSKNQILIVAGGGAGTDEQKHSGGDGGGYRGADGQGEYKGTGGTQTAAGTGYGTNAGFGRGGDAEQYGSTSVLAGSGGGAGWYGGMGGGWSATENKKAGKGGGGSGYIANSLLLSYSDITKHMTGYNVATSSEADTCTIDTHSYSADPMADTAKSGDGFARFTLLQENDLTNYLHYIRRERIPASITGL